MPTYNRGRFIERALHSVFRQTYHQLEVIVVDDGSTDDTVKRLEIFLKTDKRVLYLRHKSNYGAQVARNTGIKMAAGDYIAFLDSDDEWLPQKLELQMNLLKQTKSLCGVVYAGFRWEYDDGRPPQDKIPCFRGNIYKDSLWQWIADINTLVVRKDLIFKAGLCDERIRAYQEWDLCIRLAKYSEFDFVAEPLAIYHICDIPTISKDLLTSANGYMDIISIHRNEILQEHGNAGLSKHLLEAAYMFIKASDYSSALVQLNDSMDILSIHRNEILQDLGKAGLSAHLLKSARMFIKMYDYSSALTLLEDSICINPFDWKTLAHWFICRFRPGIFSKLRSFKRESP